MGNLSVACELIRSYCPSSGEQSGIEVVLKYDSNNELKTKLGKYLLQFSPHTDIKSLQKAGFPLTSTAYLLSFKFVKTADDFQKVLDLRKECFVWLAKKAGLSQVSEFTDRLDKRSRILMILHHNQCVGSSRIIFHGSKDKLEFEHVFQRPSDFPTNDNLIEMGRLCIKPAYREADIMAEIINRTVIIMLQARRQWLVAVTTKPLLKHYQTVGASAPNISFNVPEYNNMPVYVILIDVYKVLKGVSVGPFVWLAIYEKGLNFACQHELLTLSTMEKIRILFYKSLRPIYKLLIHFGFGSRRRSS